ncbi:hypothetical protein ON010_g4617 [Phytophthora cinnamomi]|nr:hypothetical protein ON010_g4617 [Phytophthora cinnamomi]
MTTPLSIDAYKRKQNVLAAKAHARRISATPNQPRPRSKEAYTAQQRRYLNACVEKHADPDARLLMALREARFMLKLDRFVNESWTWWQGTDDQSLSILLFYRSSLSFTVSTLKTLVSTAPTWAMKGLKVPNFRILAACYVQNSNAHLHAVHSSAIAMALGKCPKLHLLSLARCNLTDNARDHIAKIITVSDAILASCSRCQRHNQSLGLCGTQLHGVIKDESVWSSSLRGEVAPSGASMPELLINLSCNKLGDVTAETICDALYNDKWLLGLNLGENKISQQGAEMFIDTFTNNNKTLAVLGLANMKEPVATSTLDVLDSLLRVRNRFLQQVATESREKRMALGSLLLDWGVDKDTIVEICYLETLGKKIAKGTGTARLSMESMKSALVSPRKRSSSIHPRVLNNNVTNLRVHRHNNNEDDNDVEEDLLENLDEFTIWDSEDSV